MERIMLTSEPLPETEATITLDFFDPKDRDTRGTKLSERKEREGKITFNSDSYKIFSLASTSTSASMPDSLQKRGLQDFYLLWMPFTVHKASGTGYYEEITFQISIESQQTTTFDLFPRQIVNEVERELAVTVSNDFTIVQIEGMGAQPIGRHFCFTELRPTITAFGEGESIFYWLYESSPEQKGVLPGTKHALFVLQTSHGTPSVVATIRGETMLRSALSLWKSERRETEQHQVRWNLTEATPFYEADLLQAPTATEREESRQTPAGERYDVCIICALAEEGHTFMQITEQQCHVQFQKAFDKQLQLEYYFTCIPNVQGEQLRLQVSWPARHGPSEMSFHLKPLFEKFQPRFAALTGICAGDKKRVKLGDLIIAERAYSYESGKLIIAPNGEREQHFDIDLDSASPVIRRLIRTFEYKRFLQTLGDWNPGLLQGTPTYHIGAMASGSAVRADHPFDKAQFPVRDTLGVDMEGATFYRAVMDFPGMHALLAKGVADFADIDKDDSYHLSSSTISSAYMLIFIQEYVTSEHMPRR